MRIMRPRPVTSMRAGAAGDTETADAGWTSLCRLGGAAAKLAALVYMADIAITFLPGWAPPPGMLTVTDWFTMLHGNAILGLRTLGFGNTLAMVLMVPMFLGIYAAHRRVNQAYAALALVFCFLGAAIYISNNPAVTMYVLSGKYAAATTEAHRSALVAAGEAVLARGEDFTPGSSTGFLLSELASIGISLVMLRGRVFSKVTAYSGILGSAFLTIFTIWSTFIPGRFEAAIILALFGGLLNLAWLVLSGQRLTHLR